MSPAYDPAAWSAYLSVEAGASASLTGLIFVAVSINLAQIVVSKVLVARAAKAILTLMQVLAATSFALAPGQTASTIGLEIGGVCVVLWLLVTWMQHVTSHRNPYITRRTRASHFVLTQMSSLSFVAVGLSLFLHRGGGLYWLLGAVLCSFLVGLLDAWVLLIEIQR